MFNWDETKESYSLLGRLLGVYSKDFEELSEMDDEELRHANFINERTVSLQMVGVKYVVRYKKEGDTLIFTCEKKNKKEIEGKVL